LVVSEPTFVHKYMHTVTISNHHVIESEEWPRSMEMYIKSRFGEAPGLSILSELNSIYIHFLSTPQNSLSSEEVMASMKKLKFSQQWKR
jgi:hypothetical protein